MPTKEKDILQAILKDPNISFNNLQTQTQISPRILRKYLDCLRDHEQIKETCQGSGPGWKKQYVLTITGRKRLAHEMMEDLEGTCRTLQTFVEQLSEPRKLHRLRHDTAWVPNAEDFARGYITLEELRKAREPRDELLKPLWIVFRDLAKIIMKLDGPINASDELENVRFEFTEKGEPYWTVLPDVRPRNQDS